MTYACKAYNYGVIVSAKAKNSKEELNRLINVNNSNIGIDTCIKFLDSSININNMNLSEIPPNYATLLSAQRQI